MRKNSYDHRTSWALEQRHRKGFARRRILKLGHRKESSGGASSAISFLQRVLLAAILLGGSRSQLLS